jgi:hypothetical protein
MQNVRKLGGERSFEPMCEDSLSENRAYGISSANGIYDIDFDTRHLDDMFGRNADQSFFAAGDDDKFHALR